MFNQNLLIDFEFISASENKLNVQVHKKTKSFGKIDISMRNVISSKTSKMSNWIFKGLHGLVMCLMLGRLKRLSKKNFMENF